MTFMKYFYVFLDLPWFMQKHNVALVLGLYTSNHQISNMLCYFSCLSSYASCFATRQAPPLMLSLIYVMLCLLSLMPAVLCV